MTYDLIDKILRGTKARRHLFGEHRRTLGLFASIRVDLPLDG
jgi:hypothetical protein